MREDPLRDRVTAALADVFLDAESTVADAVAIAEKQIQSHRDESTRLKSEMSASDDQIGQYMPLLLDRDLEPLAKKAGGRASPMLRPSKISCVRRSIKSRSSPARVLPISQKHSGKHSAKPIRRSPRSQLTLI